MQELLTAVLCIRVYQRKDLMKFNWKQRMVFFDVKTGLLGNHSILKKQLNQI